MEDLVEGLFEERRFTNITSDDYVLGFTSVYHMYIN